MLKLLVHNSTVIAESMSCEVYNTFKALPLFSPAPFSCEKPQLSLYGNLYFPWIISVAGVMLCPVMCCHVSHAWCHNPQRCFTVELIGMTCRNFGKQQSAFLVLLYLQHIIYSVMGSRGKNKAIRQVER